MFLTPERQRPTGRAATPLTICLAAMRDRLASVERPRLCPDCTQGTARPVLRSRKLARHPMLDRDHRPSQTLCIVDMPSCD